MWGRLLHRRWPAAVVFIVAVVPRLALPWTGAGLRGSFGYDGGVYYAAADALLHGRLPYADYTLLHPPALVLALTPFAGLGTLVGDHGGYMAAVVGFAVLGAVNAALVTGLVEAMGWGRRAALVGGLTYAVWFGAVSAEYEARLEPLGNLCALLGLRALVAADRGGGRRWSVLAGAGLGAAMMTKVWWSVPALVLLVWQLVSPQRRRGAAGYVAGVAGAGVVLGGPFFVAAPSAMWHMVVTEQLHRAAMSGRLARLGHLTGLVQLDPGMPLADLRLVVPVAALVALIAAVAAWRAPFGPLVVALAVVQLAVLVRAPSYFTFYDDFLAVPVALVAGAALRRRRPVGERTRPALRIGVGVLGGALALLLAVVDVVAPRPAVAPFNVRALRPTVAGARCVMADEPMALIELNVLTSNFDHGCPNWVDVTGRTYGPDAEWGVTRPHNRRWQADLTHYLFSGQRIVVARASGTGVGRPLWRQLYRAGLLARSRTVWVFRG